MSFAKRSSVSSVLHRYIYRNGIGLWLLGSRLAERTARVTYWFLHCNLRELLRDGEAAELPDRLDQVMHIGNALDGCFEGGSLIPYILDTGLLLGFHHPTKVNVRPVLDVIEERLQSVLDVLKSPEQQEYGLRAELAKRAIPRAYIFQDRVDGPHLYLLGSYRDWETWRYIFLIRMSTSQKYHLTSAGPAVFNTAKGTIRKAWVLEDGLLLDIETGKPIEDLAAFTRARARQLAARIEIEEALADAQTEAIAAEQADYWADLAAQQAFDHFTDPELCHR